MLKRSEKICAVMGLLLLVGGLLSRQSQPPLQERIIEADGCRVPAFVLEPVGGKPIASAVVLHGLAANRRIMRGVGEWLRGSGLRVFLLDLPGHGDNTDAFSFQHAEECAAAVVDHLASRGEIQLPRTVLVGHSMGGAIAIRLGDRFTTLATVAISPAPLVPVKGVPASLIPYELPRRMPNNLLIFTGGIEPPQARDNAEELVKAAGGDRITAPAFHELRAVHYMQVSRATHTSLIWDARVALRIQDWVRQSLGQGFSLDDLVRPIAFILLDRGWLASIPAILTLFGLLLVYPAAASGLCAAFAANAQTEGSSIFLPRAMALWGSASAVSVVALKAVVPLRFVRMYTGDYLASFFLMAGALLLIAMRKDRGRSTARGIAFGAALGLATILAAGWWLNAEWTDAWLNSARWGRFPVLFLACLLYFWAEEIALGGCPQSWRAKARHYGKFLVLRLVVWMALVFAFFVMQSGQPLVFLMALFFWGFSIAQRAGADAVRKRSGSAAAAGVYGAILAAWFIAAVFPLL